MHRGKSNQLSHLIPRLGLDNTVIWRVGDVNFELTSHHASGRQRKSNRFEEGKHREQLLAKIERLWNDVSARVYQSCYDKIVLSCLRYHRTSGDVNVHSTQIVLEWIRTCRRDEPS